MKPTRVRHISRAGGLNRTIQSDARACDINLIMGNWRRTGTLPPNTKIEGSYGDFSGIDDYQSCLNRVMEAQDAFDDLPARTRDRMGNDPGRLLEFMADPSNLEESITLGLREAHDPEPPPTEGPAPQGATASEATPPPSPASPPASTPEGA